MRLAPGILGAVLIVLFGRPALAANRISNVQIAPASPAALLFNDPAEVSLHYTADPAEGVHIFARIETDGSPTPNQEVQGFNAFPGGSGDASYTVTVTTGPANVDHVTVWMTTLDDATTLAESSFPITYHFGAIARITNLQLTPPPPALLSFGDSVRVAFQYASAAGAFLFFYPFTDGAPTPGSGAREAALSGTGSGVGSFTVHSGQTAISVDRVLAQVSDVNQVPLLDFYFPVSYTFQTPVGTIPASWGILKSRNWRAEAPGPLATRSGASRLTPSSGASPRKEPS